MRWRVQVSRDIVNMVQDILETQRDSTKFLTEILLKESFVKVIPFTRSKFGQSSTTHILAFRKIGWVSISLKSIKVL